MLRSLEGFDDSFSLLVVPVLPLSTSLPNILKQLVKVTEIITWGLLVRATPQLAELLRKVLINCVSKEGKALLTDRESVTVEE